MSVQSHARDPDRDQCDAINPDLLIRAEKLQYDGYLRREESNITILARAKDSMPIKEIVRRTGTAASSLPGCSR